MNLVPVKLSPFIIHYLFKEFEGVKKVYGNVKVKSINIDCNSHIGKYIVSNLERIHYPVKNINEFNIFIELKEVKRKKFCVKQNVYKYENLSTSFLKLPEDSIKNINEMFGDLFRQNLYYYVLGYTQGYDNKVTKAIRSFIDLYELWDYMDIGELRRMYYRMGKTPGSKLQNISYLRK